jgi:microcystin-dependent protein
MQYAGPVDFDAPTGATYPAGGSQAYRLALARQGWLVCDGKMVAIARYPRLFRVIGWIYGRPSSDAGASIGFFYLPDYRGRVLRAVNGAATAPLGVDGAPVLRDPDAGSRDPQASGGWGGNAVGSMQEDGLQTHVHPYEQATSISAVTTSGSGGLVQNSQVSTGGPIAAAGAPAVRAIAETRAKNQYVHVLIRAI